MSTIQIKSESSADQQLNWVEVVRRQVGSLHYGEVQIVVHDSQVTQIEKTERVRLDKAHAQTKTIWADRKAGG
jgi:hypothetical protein